MRIVGGRFRGRRLAPVGTGDAAARLRPTTDRVREAVFNLLRNGALGDAVTGATVLDLFAGTGALGLEALSRGAAAATFVENGRAGLALLRRNVEMLEVEARILARDARRPGPAPVSHDLILLDPPYGRDMGGAALTACAAAGWIAPGAALMWEDGAPPDLPQGWAQVDQRRYGGTVITLARHGVA